MMYGGRKLPIGIQSFEDLRTNGYVYVDKTAYIHRLVTTGKPYFLARPRRFGKSLLLSTLRAYFLGKKELFEGLAMAELEKEWIEYPVFHLDMNVVAYLNLESDLYTLGFPNEEVKYGFLYELFPQYMPKTNILSEFYVWYFIEDLQAGNVENFMIRLKAFFAGIPYDLNNKTEKHYQTVFYLLFKLMGQFVEVESRSAAGRADAIVIVADTVYAFEFKLTENATVEDALKQIDDKGYLAPYAAAGKKSVKIGVEFSTEERGVRRWGIDN